MEIWICQIQPDWALFGFWRPNKDRGGYVFWARQGAEMAQARFRAQLIPHHIDTLPKTAQGKASRKSYQTMHRAG